MNRPLKLGITGGIGSGKSMVCKILESLSVPVYYADGRAKALLVESDLVKEQIIKLFGKESYRDGHLNRSYLADRVFSNPEELAKMNEIVHPAVAKDFESFIVRNSQASIIAKEAALLFETGSYKSFDHTIAVLAQKTIRINRVLLRDVQRSKEQVLQIIEKQTSDGQRKKLADSLIHNNGDELLIPQVMKIYNQLIQLASN